MVRRYKKRELIVPRKWEDLHKDVLIHIFSQMQPNELVFTVSLVCNSWRLACWDVLFWKPEGTLDFYALKYCRQEFRKEDDSGSMRLMRVLRSVAFEEDWFTCITTIVFHWSLPLCDKHLLFLAERSPRLKRVCLHCAKDITGRGFSRAIRNWKGIEEISLGPLQSHYCVDIIREIGNCKKLQVLCLCNCMLHMITVPVIAENLRNLKELRLRNLFLSRVALQVILSKCKKLVKVSITDCVGMEPEPNCIFELLEIRKIKAGSEIKWLIGSEAEVYSLNSLLESLWPRDQLVL